MRAKHLIRHAAILVSAFFLATPQAVAADNTLVGRWFAEGDEHDIHAQFIWVNRPDGTFEKTIRVIVRCRPVQRFVEIGNWTFNGKVYATVTTSSNDKPVDKPEGDRFDVTKHDAAHVDLFDEETKITWATRKVSEDYGFPLPEGCSI